HRPAGHIVRVFERNHSRLWPIIGPRQNLRSYLVPSQNSAFAHSRARLAAGKGRHHRHLPVENMRPRLADNLIALPRVNMNRNLVSHRPRRNQHRRLAPKNLRRPSLQPIHRGVFAVDIVTHFRRRHRRAHRRRRLRHRITAKINHLSWFHSLSHASIYSKIRQGLGGPTSIVEYDSQYEATRGGVSSYRVRLRPYFLGGRIGPVAAPYVYHARYVASRLSRAGASVPVPGDWLDDVVSQQARTKLNPDTTKNRKVCIRAAPPNSEATSSSRLLRTNYFRSRRGSRAHPQTAQTP